MPLVIPMIRFTTLERQEFKRIESAFLSDKSAEGDRVRFVRWAAQGYLFTADHLAQLQKELTDAIDDGNVYAERWAKIGYGNAAAGFRSWLPHLHDCLRIAREAAAVLPPPVEEDEDE